MIVMNFLIVTEPNDIHAILVSLVLESFEHRVVNLFTADFPTQQKNSVWINQTEYRCQTEDSFHVIAHQGYDVVWWRRPRAPYIPKDKIYKDDYLFHQRESQMFHDGFTHQLAPRAWWINRKEAAIRSNYKLLQLKLASEVGLSIPSTLCSNHYEDILNFYQAHQPQGIIYKPLTYQVWEEKSGFKVFYTSKIEKSSWLEQNKIQLIPGIYQQYIPKKYELRITCFGDFIVAAKLNSQLQEDSRLDWRRVPANQLKVEPYELPEKLKQQIRFLMRELGIVFGCLDFIVTPDEQYVFLEVNEQGQFLFLEEQCEDLPMLDMFIYFLLQQSINFHWVKNKKRLRMQDFYQEALNIYAENMKKHIYRRNPFNFLEEKVS